MAKKKEKNELIDLVEESKIVITPTDLQLTNISNLMKLQIELEDDITDLEERLTEMNEKLDHVKKELLPEAMLEIGMERFDLSSGEKLAIKRIIGASIKLSNREEAYQWLRKNGFGSLIKGEIVTKFPAGKEKDMRKLFKEILAKKYLAEMKETVHTQTLGAFVREQLEEGKALPMELLGVFRYEESIITRKKERNKK
jgi:hypothetical protein